MKTVSVYQESWQCGDGCCSDYWIDIYLFEDGTVISKIEYLREFGFKEDNEEGIKAYAMEHWKLKEGEFNCDF